MTNSNARRRVLLKISGEALGGDQGIGIHFPTLEHISQQIVEAIQSCGVQVAIVVGDAWGMRSCAQKEEVERRKTFLSVLDLPSGGTAPADPW